MDLLLHAPLGMSACMYGRRGFLRFPCFRSLFLSGLLGMVGLAVGQGGLYACIYPGPSGRCLVRIASMESWPDLCCPRWVPWISSAQAAVFPCTIAAPRAPHATLP